MTDLLDLILGIIALRAELIAELHIVEDSYRNLSSAKSATHA
jgi:hypothetical protein